MRLDTHTVEVMPYTGDTCHCGGRVFDLPPVTEYPLFRHGGYGAARCTHTTLCTGCLGTRVTAVETINPRGETL